MAYSGPPITTPKAAYPDYMVRKIGTVIFKEADFIGVGGFKWGSIIPAGGSVSRDTNHFYGGTGSCAMEAGPAALDPAEIKITHHKYLAGKIAFECKWSVEVSLTSNDAFHFGLENRDENLKQFRIRYLNSAGQWQVETDIDIYSNLVPVANIENPKLDTVVGLGGDVWGWCRLVADFTKQKYVIFEYAAKDGIRTYDLSNINIVDRGVTASGKNTQLYFTIGYNGLAATKKFFTTDWIISKL